MILKYFVNEIITKNYKLCIRKTFFLPLLQAESILIRITNQLTFWHLIQYKELYVTLVGHDLVNGNVNRKVS